MADKSGVYIVRNGAPVSRQIIQRIRMLVAIGAWREGERVPSAQELADHLGVNDNTVRAAYVRLLRAGVLHGEPPVGTNVAIGAKSSALLTEVVRESVAEAVGLAWSLGVPRDLLESTMRDVITSRYERKEEKEEAEVDV